MAEAEWAGERRARSAESRNAAAAATSRARLQAAIQAMQGSSSSSTTPAAAPAQAPKQATVRQHSLKSPTARFFCLTSAPVDRLVHCSARQACAALAHRAAMHMTCPLPPPQCCSEYAAACMSIRLLPFADTAWDVVCRTCMCHRGRASPSHLLRHPLAHHRPWLPFMRTSLMTC